MSRFAPGGDDGAGVGGIRLHEAGHGARREGRSLDLLPVRLEVIEGRAGGGERVGIDKGEGIHELGGQPFGVDVLADLGAAQPIDQAQQRLVMIQREAEKVLPDVLAIAAAAVEDVAAALVLRQQSGQRRVAERTGLGFEVEIDADAAGRGEEPGRGRPSRCRRPQTHPAGERLRPVGGVADELDPEVSGAGASAVAVQEQPNQAGVVAP